MKKKVLARTLVLRQETLRVLAAAKLNAVHGGIIGSQDEAGGCPAALAATATAPCAA